jgi:xanthine dehydrogenase accessory factor
MNSILSKILQKFQDGDAAMLVTVIQSAGSTPRGAGAQMAVFSDGASTGTIGGGAVEYESQQLATEYLRKKESAIKDFFLHPNDAADLGMICGGDITVYFQYLAPSKELSHFLEYIIEQCKSGKDIWLLTAIDDQGGWSMGTVNEACQTLACYGDIEIPEPDPDLLGYYCELQTGGACHLFIQPLKASGHVYVFGGGHVSQYLIPFLDMVFFPCTVVDDSGQFANRERFPLAQDIVIAPFEQVFEHLQVDSDDYIVIVTRGHTFDYNVLAQSLKTNARYIGMIGSRKKNDAVFQKLILEDGFTVTDLRRVNAPIGLPIGGETPEEIALSIAAQLVQVRASRNNR